MHHETICKSNFLPFAILKQPINVPLSKVIVDCGLNYDNSCPIC